MKFAVKTVTCIGCRTPLKKANHGEQGSPDVLTVSERAVCVNCRPQLAELYQKQVRCNRSRGKPS